MEGIKDIFSVLWILLAVLTLSAEGNGGDCEKELINIISTQFPANVGGGLLSSCFKTGSGYVYSDLKLYHKMIQLLYLTSDTTQASIKKFLKLPNDPNCNYMWCHYFKTLIKNLESDGGIKYKSFLFYQKDKPLHASVSSCFEHDEDKIAIDFSDMKATQANISKKYREYSEREGSIFLKGYLNAHTDFYLFSGLKLESKVFKDYKPVLSERMFTNLENVAETVKWMKVNGSFKYALKSEDKRVCPSMVKYILTTVNDGKYDMLYYQPVFSPEHSKAQRMKCIEGILSNLRQYITKTREIDNWNDFDSLAVPRMDFRTDADVKRYLEGDLEVLFDNNQVTRVYKTPDTLHELRCFGDLYLREDKAKEQAGDIERNLDSPFVFALVHKRLDVILNAGTHLRAVV